MDNTVIILRPVFKQARQSDYTLAARMEEARGLAHAISLDILACEPVSITRASAATLFSKGGIEKGAELVEAYGPSVVYVDGSLSPVQQRNLEREWKTKVVDRTGLILEIFSDRAETKEGKLQVELAALEYQKSRLVRSWTHLERQRATGKTGGPGETQIELDRRMIADRIVQIKKLISNVRNTRDLQRKQREKVPYPLIALVGYTNAGKSTLFNRLTGAKVMAKDMLFATLDTTTRGLTLPSGRKIMLSDTVGFITDLPTQLVAAFRATLEQVTQADVILHVQDLSDPDHKGRRQDVLEILESLGVADNADHIIDVYNKLDALDDAEAQKQATQIARRPETVAISALNGDGCDALLDLIKDYLDRKRSEHTIIIAPEDGKAHAWLHAHGEVLSEKMKKDKMAITVLLSPADYAKFHSIKG